MPHAITTVIRQMVTRANGARRVRLADPDAVVAAATRVARSTGEYDYATSGRESVPNRYKYPSEYTGWDVIRQGNRLWVVVGRLSTSSSTPLGLSRIAAHWKDETVHDYLKRMNPTRRPFATKQRGRWKLEHPPATR